MSELVTPLIGGNADIDAETEVSHTSHTDAYVEIEPLSFGRKLLNMYFALLAFSAKVPMFVMTQGGFVLYAYFSVCMSLSPFVSLVSGLSLSDPHVVISAVFTFIVVVPLLELFVIFPFGLYKEMWTGKRGTAPMSPLFWSLRAIDIAKDKLNDSPVIGVLMTIGMQAYVVVLFIIVVIFLRDAAPWTIWVMIVIIMVPSVWAGVNIGILVYKSWLYMLRPHRMTNEPQDPQANRWPFVRNWEKYLDDAQGNPVNFSVRNRVMVMHVVFATLFGIMQVINIGLLIRYFDPVFLLATLVNFVMFPFLLRFNFVNKFLGKAVTEQRHPSMHKINMGMFGVFIFLAIMFTIYTSIAAAKHPEPVTPYETAMIFSGIPPINASVGLPSICTVGTDDFGIMHYLGLASLAYDFSFDESIRDKKLELLFGTNWTELVEVTHVETRKPTRFAHLTMNKYDTNVLVIEGATSIPDSLFAYVLATLYLIPERVFNMLPFASLVFTPLLDKIIGIMNTPIGLYTPRNCLDTRLAPVLEYVNDISQTVANTIIIGYSTGGSLAKILGINGHHRAVAINSPEVRLWYLGDVSSSSYRMSYMHNIILSGQMYVGSEEGGVVEYIPFDNFPKNPGSPASMLCTAAIQCRLYTYFEDYCAKTVDTETMNQIIERTPFK